MTAHWDCFQGTRSGVHLGDGDAVPQSRLVLEKEVGESGGVGATRGRAEGMLWNQGSRLNWEPGRTYGVRVSETMRWSTSEGQKFGIKRWQYGILRRPCSWDSALSLSRPQVQSLVRELRSPAGSRVQSKKQKQIKHSSIRLSTARIRYRGHPGERRYQGSGRRTQVSAGR